MVQQQRALTRATTRALVSEIKTLGREVMRLTAEEEAAKAAFMSEGRRDLQMKKWAAMEKVERDRSRRWEARHKERSRRRRHQNARDALGLPRKRYPPLDEALKPRPFLQRLEKILRLR
jgi:hypothetical protein